MSLKSVLKLEAAVDETVAIISQEFKDDAKLGRSSNFSYHARYVEGSFLSTHARSVHHGLS